MDLENLKSLNKAELIVYCKENSIKGYSNKKKDELIKLIENHKNKHIQSNQSNKSNQSIKTNNTELTADIKIEPLLKQIPEQIPDQISDFVQSNISESEPQNDVSSNKLRLIDLFAGTGAFSYAFENTNKVDIVFSNDMNETSEQIYNANFNHKLTLKNLIDIDVKSIPKHNILTGGFPCQPFSISGKQLGFQDPRANTFWKILEIIEYHKPECIILENVKNLVSHDDNKTFKIITDNLIKKGYHLHHKVLNTSTITKVPQHRERIYIVGFIDKNIHDKFDLEFPKVNKDSITSYLDPDAPNKYYYTDKLKIWNSIESSIVKSNTIYQYRRVYVRENKNGECPTLTANMGGGGHNVPLVKDNKGIRKLTPRECFNLQGFPRNYKLPKLTDSHLYKLAGNAVSVPVVELLANKITSILKQ